MFLLRATSIRLLFVVGLLVVIVYDFGIVATGYYRVDSDASQVASEAADRYRISQSRSQALAAAEAAAQSDGVVLVGFDIRDGEARVRLRSVPTNTLIAYRIAALRPSLVAESYSSAPIY